ncbi:MAG: enoyl-CoA hydratase/isomerase family protein, partial [Tritonibacter mobilis]|nr:enoyl-CoA hydratase/isomerase family protein [Tritonibacter mobilis]
MDYRDIQYSLADGLATVTLNRPQSMNALTSQMRAEITHAMKAAAAEARAVVLTGAG